MEVKGPNHLVKCPQLLEYCLLVDTPCVLMGVHYDILDNEWDGILLLWMCNMVFWTMNGTADYYRGCETWYFEQ